MKNHEQALAYLKKAVDDVVLLEEIIKSTRVSDEIFGFHCQQAAEKLLKALLSKCGIDFPRTHNLRLLIDLLSDVGHSLPEDLADLDSLTPYGTLFRYESLSGDVNLDRQQLMQMVRLLRRVVENFLNRNCRLDDV